MDIEHKNRRYFLCYLLFNQTHTASFGGRQPESPTSLVAATALRFDEETRVQDRRLFRAMTVICMSSARRHLLIPSRAQQLPGSSSYLLRCGDCGVEAAGYT